MSLYTRRRGTAPGSSSRRTRTSVRYHVLSARRRQRRGAQIAIRDAERPTCAHAQGIDAPRTESRGVGPADGTAAPDDGEPRGGGGGQRGSPSGPPFCRAPTAEINAGGHALKAASPSKAIRATTFSDADRRARQIDAHRPLQSAEDARRRAKGARMLVGNQTGTMKKEVARSAGSARQARPRTCRSSSATLTPR